MWGCGSSSFFRFGSAGWWCAWGKRMWGQCRPQSLSDGGLLITGVRLGHASAGSWTVGYWLMTGPVGYEGESGSLVTLSL